MADEMLLVMHASNGIGLAAPQVGINKRLMVFSLSDNGKDIALVNPSILSTAEEVETEEEGCLSFPQINGEVTRPAWVEVQYQSLTGEKFKQRFKNFEARVFQHEFDHLQQVLFVDRFNDKDKGSNKKRLEKMVKKFGPDAKP